MILTDDDRLIVSASDITTVASCEFRYLRRVDVLLGRAVRERVDDPFRDQLADLGRAHESDVDQQHRANHDDFVVAPRAAFPFTTASLTAAAHETKALVHAGHSVIAQPVLFSDGVFAIPDYLIRQADGAYEVWDAKLARSVKPEAALQLAVCAALLDQMGVASHTSGGLFLGDGTDATVDLAELTEDARRHLARARRLFVDHQADTDAFAWGDDSAMACGSCDDCSAAIEEHHDVKLVYKLRMKDRQHLRDAGITTIQEFAESTGPVDGIAPARLETLRAQARLQAQQVVHDDGSVTVAFEVFDPGPIARMPAPSDGDVFFDFEGDSMVVHEDGSLGIEYLWGLHEASASGGEYVHAWAEDRTQEGEALQWFCERISSRLSVHPDLHIYHYGGYEITALKRLCQQHGIGEEQVHSWIDAELFVDLNKVVMKSIRISQPKYGLKYLEPLYSPPRTAGVQNARASMVGFADYIALLSSGDTEGASKLRTDLINYNRDDCLSTQGLRDWLTALDLR